MLSSPLPKGVPASIPFWAERLIVQVVKKTAVMIPEALFFIFMVKIMFKLMM
jgi:hypothetical protein